MRNLDPASLQRDPGAAFFRAQHAVRATLHFRLALHFARRVLLLAARRDVLLGSFETFLNSKQCCFEVSKCNLSYMSDMCLPFGFRAMSDASTDIDQTFAATNNSGSWSLQTGKGKFAKLSHPARYERSDRHVPRAASAAAFALSALRITFPVTVIGKADTNSISRG